MADRLSKLRVVDPVLTSLARGYRNAQYIGEGLFPVAEMEKEAGIIPRFGKEAFRLWETERAIRGKSNVMTADDPDTLDVVLREHDLSYPVDYREQAESMFNEEAKAAKRVKDAIDLGREVAAARLAQNSNTYLAGAKVTLAGAAKWVNGGGDPIKDIEDGKEVVRQRTGMRPNTVAMGAAAYASLKFHPKLAAALGTQERKLITLEHLKAIWGVEHIHIGEALAADGNGATGDIWGDNVILAYVAKPGAGESADHDIPSFGYTLRKKGMPETDKYNAEGNKVQYVRHTDVYKVVVVGADAGYLIADVN
ncbi:major capsid protein [Jeongeupia wiesaeckerbachi]|uniref:major capsid protein n=1 Tax=Jeongeupia wiesaeckerbachi TaxID=3051218 RepID=UPI003D80600C